MLIGERAVQEVGNDGVKDSVAQVLEALVVGPAPVVEFHGLGAVDHRQLVQADVARVVSGDAVYKNIKLLILDEKEPYE